jgi:outer membrane protein assembly factor BamB
LVYLCRENGVLVCVDAKSGQQLYEERTVSDRHRASPIYAAGHLYLTARKGTITVVKAGPKFEQVAVNDLAEPTTASPVISQGRIYVRTFAALYAIEER